MRTLACTTSASPDFRALVHQPNHYLAELDGAEHEFYAPYNTVAQLQHVVVAYQESQPVGCGAFRELESGPVEIRRMFVVPTQWQRGVARAVLGELGRGARELSYAACVLEIGQRQPAAIALYERQGYARIPSYGQYVGVANSVCLQKKLP